MARVELKRCAGSQFGRAVVDAFLALQSDNSAPLAGCPRGLYWLTSAPERVLPAVRELMSHAAAAGVEARFVRSANFDETFGVIARHVTLPDVAQMLRR